MNLLLSSGTVVTSLAPARVEQADVLVADGRVAAIGQGLAIPDDTERIDCGGSLVVPGNVCAHTHVYSALARGMPYRLEPPTSFVEILQRIWWRLDRALDPASIRASALVAAREALLAGTTTLVDHHASPNAIDRSLDIVADAFEEIGLRSVLCYEVTDRDGPERAVAGVAENRRFLGKVTAGAYPLARGMVGAHASFTLSEATLAACVALAREAGTGIHVHVAEDAADETDATARFDRRVVGRLADAGALTDRSLLAHGVHLDPFEAELVREVGATMAHNPRSNMNNGVGRTPLTWLGDRVALGTDGIGADMFEESRAAYLRRREEELATGPDWALARLAQGSLLAGRLFGEPLLGQQAVGAPADLAVLEYEAPTRLDSSNFGGHWIFGLSAAAVRDVVVAGEPVVRDRRLARVDEGELLATARTEAEHVWARLETMGAHPYSSVSAQGAVPAGGASWRT